MRHVTGYTRKQDRQLFDKRRPWAPGKRPPTPPSTLYPGSNVRILSSAPQWAFGPNAPPVYPGHMPDQVQPQASAEPEPTETAELSTTEAQIEQTKEIVAPESDEQDALEPSQPPQLEPDETKEMTEEPSFTAPEEAEETEQIEDPPDPDTKHPIPIRITFQDREEPHQRRNREGEISLNYHSVRCSICNHPEREAIEQGYLHWENPTYLTHEYG